MLTGSAETPAAVGDLAQLMVKLIRAKRSAPGEDLLSALVAAHDNEDELTSPAFLLLFAGYENSVNLIGNGVLALLPTPTGWPRRPPIRG